MLAGMLVGFCVGITGVGGGSLMTPILISLFRIEPHIAIGTDLLYAAISKFCGSMVHARKLNIVWPIVLWLAVGSIPASFITSWVLEHYLSQSTHYKAVLTMVLGFMLTLTGVSIIFRTRIEKFFNKFRSKEVTQTENEQLAIHKKRSFIVIMGIILGVFVTLSSVGAGAFGIMALVIMFPNLPMIRIIGSDVVHAVLLTLVAGLGHMSAGNVDFTLLMWLLVGSIPAIIIGTLI
ncbi:sulfite exporter TauE/SafE family protein, partial [Acinetobacter sp. A11]